MGSKVNSAECPSVLGYCRVSTIQQDYERQKLEILEYANRNGWNVKDFIQTKVSCTKSEAERGLEKLKEAAMKGEVNIILFSELSRLSRSVGHIILLVERFVNDWNVELHFIKENMILRKGKNDIASKVMLTMFSLLAEIEHDLICERTRDALNARRLAGVKLGRPKLKSKLDNKEDEIKAMVQMGIKQIFIAKKMDCTEATLSNWLIRKRKEWAGIVTN
jgi:DNA invertase Pin-like site-specific DNA recombinase